MLEDKWKAISDALKPVIKKQPILISYDLYCKTCFMMFEVCRFDNETTQPFQCKNGHLTIRLMDMCEISTVGKSSTIFDVPHSIAYNND